MRHLIGVDIGGTNVVVGTVPEDGSTVLGLVQEPTAVSLGADGVVKQIARLAQASLTEARRAAGGSLEVAGVGMGAPGPLNRESGLVLLTPNLGWRDYPLRDRVSDALGLPGSLDNDANCAVFGEWWRGAARGSRLAMGVTIGTGIGGGLVIDGQIYHGASGVAGEFGHMTIDSTGRRCKCGNYGCLEAYASGTAIAARAVEGIEAGDQSRLPQLVGGDLSKITAETVYRAAAAGDTYAEDVIKDTTRFLGAGVANLINIFNPEVCVILGGVTQAGEHLFGPLRAEVARRAFRPAVDAVTILPGALPGTAGVFGAVAAFKVQHWGEA